MVIEECDNAILDWMVMYLKTKPPNVQYINLKQRGINMVVINPDTGQITSKKAFDTSQYYGSK